MIDVTDGPAYVVRAIMTYIPVILVCLEGKPHIGARFTVLFIFATWLTEVAQDNIGGVAGIPVLYDYTICPYDDYGLVLHFNNKNQ